MKTIIISAICLLQLMSAFAQESKTIPLDGSWRVALDVFYQGTKKQWYKMELPSSRDLHVDYVLYFRRSDYLVADWMHLPGTMEEANIGVKVYPEKAFSEGLQKKITCDAPFWIPRTVTDAPFWIQRTVTIPPGWNDKAIVFSMERTIGICTMYWDGQLVGEASGYEVPHKFELNNSLTSAGDHIITVFVNRNDKRYKQVGHGVVGENGTEWIGVVGKIEMQVQNSIYVKNLQIYPNIENGTIKATFDFGQNSKQNKDITINFSVRKKKSGGKFEKIKTLKIQNENIKQQSLDLVLPKPVELWTEFNPCLYELKTEVLMNDLSEDESFTTFGMRKFATENGNFTLNGKKIF
ncbi:MAG: hypothetical protein Q8R96_07665 [Bacteroidota bacterium]|nr:hypothetical protein [Bacteroidota bacterium]